jgi:NAD-dependent dihydropyrimidine dehydrogenase PreA subunit
MGMSDLVRRFSAAFGVWEVARPYLPLMVEEEEMRLVVEMAGRSLTLEELVELLQQPEGDMDALLTECVKKGILERLGQDGRSLYRAGDFYNFLNDLARYGNWEDLPAEGRAAIERRCLDEFIARQRPDVERKMRGEAAEHALPNDAVMLLPEVEAMLDAASEIVVQPCDCRRLAQRCDRPVEVCIWMDDGARGALARGHGRRVGGDEAKELVRWADKKGLMHTADPNWRTNGLHAICNCCACDCYPFRAAAELGSKGVWPESRYIAVYRPEPCTLCGVCIGRCHFEAFFHNGTQIVVEGKSKQGVAYDPEKCWGCGLCANTCPSGAIVMERLTEAKAPRGKEVS